MTQVASPESVRGNFDGVNLTLDGQVYRLKRRGDEFWVEMVDPDWTLNDESTPQPDATGSVSNSAGVERAGPRVERRISMVTGSHRMQAYWVDNGHGNQQFSLPFTFLFEQNRWVPGGVCFSKFLRRLRGNRCGTLVRIVPFDGRAALAPKGPGFL